LQDTSRSFLCGAVADRTKYELFMQATMLEPMLANLHRVQGFVDQMKAAAKDIDADHGCGQMLCVVPHDFASCCLAGDLVGDLHEQVKDLAEDNHADPVCTCAMCCRLPCPRETTGVIERHGGSVWSCA
jgi:hypothetical protein